MITQDQWTGYVDKNFREENQSNLEWLAKQEEARKLARTVLIAEACLYSQWFTGEKNIGGDSLLRD